MDRAYRLQFCEKCSLRSFSIKKGLICSITNEPADFDEKCSNYIVDLRAEKEVIERNLDQAKRQQHKDTMGLSKYGIKNGIVAGCVLLITALVWLALGIALLERIFYFPFVMIVLGIIAIERGMRKNN